MSDCEEPEERDGELPGLAAGQLERFVRALSPKQRALWTPIRQAWEGELARARRESSKSHRDTLYESMNAAQGKITAEKIETLIDNAVAKGDAQVLRVMAQMAGIDLTDRPQQATGEGAKVIIIRPHPKLLTPEEEAEVQRRIENR